MSQLVGLTRRPSAAHSVRISSPVSQRFSGSASTFARARGPETATSKTSVTYAVCAWALSDQASYSRCERPGGNDEVRPLLQAQLLAHLANQGGAERLLGPLVPGDEVERGPVPVPTGEVDDLSLMPVPDQGRRGDRSPERWAMIVKPYSVKPAPAAARPRRGSSRCPGTTGTGACSHRRGPPRPTARRGAGGCRGRWRSGCALTRWMS